MHPVITEYGLKTYRSKYDNQRCCISGKSVQVGEEIANVVPIMPRLQRLGLIKTKVFKYAAVKAIPVPATSEEVEVIKAVAEVLLAATDPNWPKDDMGCSVSSYGPLANWRSSGYDPLGATHSAKALIQHLGTQIPKDGEVAKVILEVSRRSYMNGQGTPVQAPVVPEVPKSMDQTTTLNGKTVVIRATRKTGEVLIDKNGAEGLKLYFDAPWVNKGHGILKDKVKAMGARWDPDTRCWRLGPSIILANWSVFAQQNLVVTQGALEALGTAVQLVGLSSAEELDDTAAKEKIKSVLPEGLEPYPFQYAAVEFIEKANGRALVADEPGLGKSITTLMYLALHPELRPAVLVVPAVVLGNWAREARIWTPQERVQVIRIGKDKLDPDATIFVVGYDMLRKHIDKLIDLSPKVVVGDEVHLCKNYKTQRAESFVKLAKADTINSVIGLSGTPIVNRPVEFFPFLNLLNRQEFGSWKNFTARYCGGHYEQVSRSRTIWACSGATNTNELNLRLRSLMIRRTKDKVLTELPAKIRQITPVDMDSADATMYRVAAGGGYDNALAQITELRKVVGTIKAKAAVEWVKMYASNDTPLVVFAHHKEVLDTLQEGCKKEGIRFGRIDGSVSADNRTRLVEQFQDGALDCMLLSTKAAGVGITLTRASNILVVERQWTPGDELQAEDRCHRIGQSMPVTIRYLMVEDTVDEKMAELIDQKVNVLTAVLDGNVIDGELDIRKELTEWLKEQKK